MVILIWGVPYWSLQRGFILVTKVPGGFHEVTEVPGGSLRSPRSLGGSLWKKKVSFSGAVKY